MFIHMYFEHKRQLFTNTTEFVTLTDEKCLLLFDTYFRHEMSQQLVQKGEPMTWILTDIEWPLSCYLKGDTESFTLSLDTLVDL